MSKITIFALDLPYPPTSGGRLDVWSHLLALAQAGHELQVWCFARTAPEPDFFSTLRAQGICEVSVLPLSGYWRDARGLKNRLRVFLAKLASRIPLACAATRLDSTNRSRVVAAVRAFTPDLIIAHGIQTSGAVRQLAGERPEIPWIYRSHNHETVYHKELMKAAPWGLEKASLFMEYRRFRAYEPVLLREAGAVLHISLGEYQHFKNLGFKNQWWAPPLYELPANPPSPRPCEWQVGILSSWFATQKIEGLKWFGEQVRPRLPADWKIAIAGSSAPAWLASWCQAHGMIFIGQVPSPAEFYAVCVALANPVLRGAGVNMKTMEMLASGRPVVSTPAGLAGLPPEIGNHLYLAADPKKFADQLLLAVSEPSRVRIDNSSFTPFAPAHFIATVNSAIATLRRPQ